MARAAAMLDKGVTVRDLTVAAEEGQLGRVRDFVVEVCEDWGSDPNRVRPLWLSVG